ncbi:VanZ family protein [Fusibacter tunisiensis]|uniref:VanZ family protein n=1 Tax=Fusibacter tunisiensis TaxID=1008308 RepID=A0ABS2MN52_9FIRM|nr:VanZ family protein [Fusibacter tunisiensis]
MIQFFKRKWVRWTLVGLCMFAIFMMSHLNNVKSWYLTGELLTVIKTGSVDTETSYEEKMTSYNESGTADLMVYLRKLAHVMEYFALGVLLFYALSYDFAIRKSAVAAMGIGWFYGYLDELHQLFIPGRTGSLMDVFLDGFGVTLGVLFSIWLAVKVRKGVKHEA